MTIKYVQFGNRIRDARLAKKLTQAQVAEKVNITRANVIEFEQGLKLPTPEIVLAFSIVLQIDEALLKVDLVQNSDDLVTLFRMNFENVEGKAKEQIEKEIVRLYSVCRSATEIKATLGLPLGGGPPEYTAQGMTNTAAAAFQGESCAAQERDRLGLGNNPIPDMADLISSQGIWATGAELPESMSGLFMRELRIGMVVIVNFKHSQNRKRFSYAHEYAHALLDRNRSFTVSKTDNREDLYEVRANAFAAAFLLPKEGVEHFFASRGKGRLSKQEIIVFDGQSDQEPVRTTSRTVPGSQEVSYQDVALLAIHFKVSYLAATYRLRSINFINQKEMTDLLDKAGIAKNFQELISPTVVDPSDRGDLELVSQVMDFSIEAFRRGLIDRNRLQEIGDDIKIGGSVMVSYAEQALN